MEASSVVTKTKGLGILPTNISSMTREEIVKQKWNLLQEEVSFPTAVLNEKTLHANLSWMKEFVNAYNVQLCPHGKTSMSPALFRLQLGELGGSWGISLATAPQVAIAHQFGVKRVLLVNQLVGKINMSIISDILLKDPEFSFACIVDSAKNVELLAEFFKARNQKLRILLEFGFAGGRTGIRNNDDENSVLTAISKCKDTLTLVGVEFFEGILKEENAVRTFIQNVVTRTEEIQKHGHFGENVIILTGAGSSWFDIVAEELTKGRELLEKSNLKSQIILRPGCYLTHDKGMYTAIEKRIKERIHISALEDKELKPALQIWAYVQSIPEPDLAIIGLGRRDVAFDVGFPVPAFYFRPGWKNISQASPDWTVINMMDQHVFLNIGKDKENAVTGGGDDDTANKEVRLQVGDIVIFDIIHSCTTFDKYKNILIADQQFNIVDIVSTYF